MSVVEKVMLIAAVLMPMIALMLFLPKFIKQKLAKARKGKQLPTSPYVPEPADVKSNSKEASPKLSTLSHADDFKDYALSKTRRMSAPKRNFPTSNFDTLDSFRPMPISKPAQEKTLAEEIKGLSPELKALILSGALDKKDYDE